MNLSIPTDDEADQRLSGVVGTSNHERICGAKVQEDRENDSSWKRRKMNPCDETMDGGSGSSCAADEMDDAMDIASSSRGTDPFGAVTRTAGVVEFPAGSVGIQANVTTNSTTMTFSEPQPPRNSLREYCYYCSCYYCGCQEVPLGHHRVYTSA